MTLRNKYDEQLATSGFKALQGRSGVGNVEFGITAVVREQTQCVLTIYLVRKSIADRQIDWGPASGSVLRDGLGGFGLGSP